MSVEGIKPVKQDKLKKSSLIAAGVVVLGLLGAGEKSAYSNSAGVPLIELQPGESVGSMYAEWIDSSWSAVPDKPDDNPNYVKNVKFGKSFFESARDAFARALSEPCVKLRFLGNQKDGKPDPKNLTVLMVGQGSDFFMQDMTIPPKVLRSEADLKEFQDRVRKMSSKFESSTSPAGAIDYVLGVIKGDPTLSDVRDIELDEMFNGRNNNCNRTNISAAGGSPDTTSCVTQAHRGAIKNGLKVTALVQNDADEPLARLQEYFIEKVATGGIVFAADRSGGEAELYTNLVQKMCPALVAEKPENVKGSRIIAQLQ